jgi:rhodanese-related sulfurtransferase
MDRLFEFVVNHYILASLFVAFLIAIFIVESRRGGAKVSSQGLVSLMNQDKAVIVDIRDRKDFAEGHISGSIHMPLSGLKSRINELSKFKDQDVQIVVVDKMGQHAAMAVKQLNAEGFENVERLNGGIADWQGANMPLVKK